MSLKLPFLVWHNGIFSLLSQATWTSQPYVTVCLPHVSWWLSVERHHVCAGHGEVWYHCSLGVWQCGNIGQWTVGVTDCHRTPASTTDLGLLGPHQSVLAPEQGRWARCALGLHFENHAFQEVTQNETDVVNLSEDPIDWTTELLLHRNTQNVEIIHKHSQIWSLEYNLHM